MFGCGGTSYLTFLFLFMWVFCHTLISWRRVQQEEEQRRLEEQRRREAEEGEVSDAIIIIIMCVYTYMIWLAVYV